MLVSCNWVRLISSYFAGFDALAYKEHLDYSLVQSTNPEYNKALVRVNIFRDHRQTIQVYNLLSLMLVHSLVDKSHAIQKAVLAVLKFISHSLIEILIIYNFFLIYKMTQ